MPKTHGILGPNACGFYFCGQIWNQRSSVFAHVWSVSDSLLPFGDQSVTFHCPNARWSTGPLPSCCFFLPRLILLLRDGACFSIVLMMTRQLLLRNYIQLLEVPKKMLHVIICRLGALIMTRDMTSSYCYFTILCTLLYFVYFVYFATNSTR